ncbi:MAG: DUF979 domain-containing protein [Angelakisella sp.]
MNVALKLSEISAWGLSKTVAEMFYIIIGVIFVLVGLKALKDTELKTRWFTAFFWFIVAFTFIAGPYLPAFVTGLCVIVMAVLTALGKVRQSKSDVPTPTETRKHADKLGYGVFIPAISLAIAAVLVATFWKSLGANNAIGVSGVIALLVAFLVTKCKPKYAAVDGARLMDNVGSVGLLPQILAALGALFTAAGVGNVIATGVKTIIPDGSKFIAVAVYCIAMAIFTIIMGNGFAAFSVITVGVGIPFLIAQGADPLVVGAMGLTAGFCGTLMTPMAANFNIMPAALLETNDKYSIIKSQLPVALTMLVIHIILMYVLAF